MAFKMPITIADAVHRIQVGGLVLPAIQREFVWSEPQIVRLFDSLLRGYPIGSFLSWNVQPPTVGQFRFYGFLRDYHEKNNPYCPVLDLPQDRGAVAVLDGQQRLTSLNIGLRGSYASRIRYGWRNNPNAYPKKRLYVNALAPAAENELGMMYDFRLLTDAQTEVPDDVSDVYWYPVHRILGLADISDLMAEPGIHGLGSSPFAVRLIGGLHKAVHTTGALYFYEEDDQDVEKVLDIFIRVNSGGEPLSYSDLLMSIATAQWIGLDAREEIRTLVRTLNATGYGFRFGKDTVLKAGLVLSGVGDIGFKVRNFNHANMAQLEKDWPRVSQALTLAVELLHDFGLSEATLSAHSVLIPVATYVHHRGLDSQYRTAVAEAEDRANLRGWVLRSLVKQGIWGSGLDTLLRDVRGAITEHGRDGFPVAQIEARMERRGKGLVFTPEEIDDLLDMRYGGARTFGALALLFSHVNTRNVHHVDHVFPRAMATVPALMSNGLDRAAAEEVVARRDMLANLQLLEGPENVAKRDTPPLEWARKTFPDEAGFHHYLARSALPYLPEKAQDFDAWFTARRNLLADRLTSMLGVRLSGDASSPEAEDVPEARPVRRDEDAGRVSLSADEPPGLA